MARYPKRQKVKRYRRSFYTREMRLKKGIGIAVLVVAVLAAAWVAAPHVLDWATHTWYTVVRDRDLSASSAVSESASSGAQSTAASEPAASSVPEKEPEPAVKGTDIVTGRTPPARARAGDRYDSRPAPCGRGQKIAAWGPPDPIECTYANDCTVVDFEEKDWFKITV